MAKGLVVLLCFVLLVSMTAATQFQVCGTGQWNVPQSGAKSYNQWAQETRFKVGDTVVFTYPANNDSVLLVDSNSYNSCDTSSPIDRFSDGNTIFTLTRSGPFYFISGNQDNCKKDEKLHIVVLGNHNSTGSAPSPSPSPPPPPPSPPAAAETPSTSSPPPPLGDGDIAPATSTPPPPSAASLPMISLMGMLGFVFLPFFNLV